MICVCTHQGTPGWLRAWGCRPKMSKCPYCLGTGNYAKVWWLQEQHRRRYRRYVEGHGLPCQDCHGYGGETEPILDDGSGPFTECGWCEGTGLVTKHIRGQWLTYRRNIKSGKGY